MSRRFQFSLRALLVAVIIVAVPCAWIAQNAHLVQQRNEMLEKYNGADGPLWRVVVMPGLSEPKELPWVRRALGDSPVLAFKWGSDADSEVNRRLLRLFPEAKIVLKDHQIWSAAAPARSTSH